MSPLEYILDKARWAPSGDNVQNWRFEIISEDAFIIRAFDTRDTVVYDFDGRPSQIALGALLENISLAASHQQRRAEFLRMDSQENRNDSRTLAYQVRLLPVDICVPHPLVDMIEKRSVQRRALSTSSLSEEHQRALEQAVGENFSICWFGGWQQRWKMAKLLWRNAKIRLTMPEAFPTHKKVIDWGKQFSEDRIPDQAIGMDKLGLLLMRWAMHSWQRVNWMNRYMAGTWLPRLQLDLIPALFCATHFMIVAKQEPQTVEDFVAAGRSLQGFWLTATQLGIQLQPEMTPLIFSWYVKAGRSCSDTAGIQEQMLELQQSLAAFCHPAILKNTSFMGRIGYGKPAQSRSLRLKLQDLFLQSSSEGKNDTSDYLTGQKCLDKEHS
ncbi:nitroreductase family protein [Undibacterium sp.]|uniref:nitroreductase family protein n=1 Tax=Undibacterium sp. TaxID=1914977 RepID=UPI00273161DE|nr:nitroreductase family protein [Undibacterium sp.]MDP1980576.1 nitroreductase family protein [Undibacterium sp.]